MEKLAPTNHPIHALLQARWSPRAYSNRPIAQEDILSIFEAARWSPSGNNLQPWAFIVAMQGTEGHQKFVEILAGFNQRWAKDAPMLVLAVAQRERAEGKPNAWAAYDLGQSVAHLTIQAAALGLFVHQMGGFDKDRSRQEFDIPQDYEPMTAIAIGYAGSPDELPEDLRERELAPRTRKSLETFVFSNHWNQPIEVTPVSNL